MGRIAKALKEDILFRYDNPEYWNEEIIEEMSQEIIEMPYEDFVKESVEMDAQEKEWVISKLEETIEDTDPEDRRLADYNKKLKYLKGEII